MSSSQFGSLRDTPPDSLAPIVQWDDFMSYVFDWKQNQHVGIIGPTEQGKTNLTYHILSLRKYVTYFAIKTRDETLDGFAQKGGFERIETWPPMKKGIGRKRPLTPDEMPKRLLWPDATSLNAEEQQKKVFEPALHDIYAQGGWCPVFDDYWYLSNILKFEKETKKYLANARSNNIPMVICAQRPAGNRLVELFDQSTHLFFARDNDKSNLDRISGVGWLSADPIRAFVARLERYQFLYVNTRTGWMFRTTAPELKFTKPKGSRRG